MKQIIPQCNTFKHLFVKESNAIDPQPGYDGNHPDCPLYVNHMEALDFMLSNDWELTKHTPLDVHRILTKGIPFFEDRGMSGMYRNCDVYIGTETCPNPYRISDLMETWFDVTSEMMQNTEMSPMEIAWTSHHMFEVIHPFIDGNGRTGRLLLNKILVQLGQDPVIINYSDRYYYYNTINFFRDHYFDDGNFVNLDIF
jgi:Fic family protein